MSRVLLMVIGLAATAPLIASAQTGFAPAPPSYALSPGSSPIGQNPVQQQVLENYRIQLQQSQREMLQQNPSGLGREQIEVTRQLNNYNALPPASYTAAPPPAATRVPPASYYAVAPAFDTPSPVTRHAARHAAPRHPAAEPAAAR
jgi:hypothetical protein